MKNNFFKCLLFCLICIIFSSCRGNDAVKNETDKVFWNSKKCQYDYGVTKQEYEGHSYIFFKEGYRMAVVHNPDCNCNKNDSIKN